MQIQDFINQWCLRNKCHFNRRFQSIGKNGWSHFWKDYRDCLFVENEKREKKDKLPELGERKLENEWTIGLERLQKAYLQTIKDQISHRPSDDFQIDLFLKAMTGKLDPTDKAVLQHWLWSVKRKLFGKPIHNHIMLMFFEKAGGSGKSTAIRKLTGPLSEFTLLWDFQDLADLRNRQSLADNYIAFFDEMPKPTKCDVDTLKNQITAEYNSTRTLGTNRYFNCPQNCCFIGAANKPLTSLILDTTNMRRFYQLDCIEKNDTTGTRIDWEAINSIDYNVLWQNIDEDLEQGYLIGDALKSCQARQLDLKQEDLLTLFCEETNLIPIESEQVFAPWDQVYQAWVRWSQRNGNPHTGNSSTFSKNLASVWTINRVKKFKRRGLYINSAHRLDSPGNLDEQLETIIGKGNRGAL